MRRSFLKWFALFLVGCLIPFYSIACSVQTPNASGANSGQPLSVGISAWAGFKGHYVATDKNYFGEENLKVAEQNFPSFTDLNTALTAGKVDLGWVGGTDLIQLAQQNPNLRIIMMSDYSDGADAIAGRGITKPEDLRGKKLAREDIPYEMVFVGEYLKKAGLTEKDVEIVPLTAPDGAAAYATGKVDAVATYEPFLSMALKEGKGEVIFSTKGTSIIPNVLATSAQVIQERREEVLAYMRAVGKGVEFADANPEDAAKIVAAKIGVKPEEIPAQLAGIATKNIQQNKDIPFNNDSPMSLLSSMKAAATTLHKLGKTPQLVDVNTLIDSSLIQSL